MADDETSTIPTGGAVDGGATATGEIETAQTAAETALAPVQAPSR